MHVPSHKSSSNDPSTEKSPTKTPLPEKGQSEISLQQQVLSQYEAGQYLEALQMLEPHGGLAALTGASGRSLAGRLAGNLGADRYGAAIHLRAWRNTPDANSLGFFVGSHLGRTWGPMRGIDFLEQLTSDSKNADQLTPLGRSDIASAKSYLWSAIRDFSKSEAALEEGLRATPDRAWLRVTRGYLLAAQDLPEQALAAHQEALAIRPNYRPAVQSAANELVQLNRVDEARELLLAAGEQLQSGAIYLQLAQLERELSNYEVAQRHLEAGLKYLPLRDHDRDSASPYTGFEATLAYHVGKFDEAIRLSKKSKLPFHETVAKNLEENLETGRRVVLDVGFTLQHDMTCVPATLSTLTKFWNQPVDHLDIAEAICYDGTPAHAERDWLESQGFFCREFTLTWETAMALIDAGIPFTQTLVGYAAGHMLAVIGYDSYRGVLIYRDPNVRHSGEFLAKELIEKMQSTGPRGMVFVPESMRERVEQLDLPDHELWALCHQVSSSLNDHRRSDAVAACKQLQTVAADHRLTLHALGRLAAYDGDLRKLLKVTEKLIEKFPKDQNQWSTKLRLLQQIGTRDERLESLEKLCDQSDCATVYQHQLLGELLDDPKEKPRVDRLLRRCIKSSLTDAATYHFVALRHWNDGKREDALAWYRAAACLESRDDNRAMTYFSAARALNRKEEALQMLRDRFERFNSLDSGPGRSLVEAYDQMYQSQQAGEVLQTALKARPEDGELQLFASRFLMRLGRHEEADSLLKKARGKCHESDWLAAAARLAQLDNRLDEAFAFLKESIKRAPLHLRAHHHAVEVLADSQGPAAAIEHLNEYVDRFPKNVDLRTLLIETLAEIGPEEAEAEARRYLKLHPHDAWCWRELGFKLAEQRRWQEAHEAAKQASELEPTAMQNFLLLGMIFAGVGKNDQARKYFFKAIKISVDYSPAINELMRLCDTRCERQQALTQVLAQLKSQVIHGVSLHLFRSHAERSFEAKEALQMVEQARQSRPDLWQAWSVVVTQLLSMKQLDKALKVAEAAAKRFPLLPDTLIDLADVQQELGLPEEVRRTIDRALAIDSRNGQTLRQSATAFQRTGDIEGERQAIERACQSEPRNVTHQGALAELLWREGKRDRAIATIKSAIEQEPDYEWGWDQLTDWSFLVKQPELLIEMATEITESRPKSPAMWRRRAETLARFPEHSQDCLAAYEQSLKLDPRDVDSHEQRALMLTNLGEFDQAIAACSPKVFGKNVPLQLQARAAVIQYQRGETTDAIARMEKVVASDSNYSYAWSQLAGWHQQEGDHDQALKCAQQLLETAPRAAASWGYVADCYLSLENPEEAAKHLQRSIELDPTYLFGGHTLISLQTEDESLGDERYDAALQTLAVIGPHMADHDRAVMEAKLQGLAGRAEPSLKAYRQAVAAPTDSGSLLLETTDCLLQKGWAEPLKALIEKALDERRATPQAAGVLVEILAREGATTKIQALCDKLDPGSLQWAEAASVYIEALGDAGESKQIDGFILRREKQLRRQGRSWGLVGLALQTSGQEQKAIEWMSDWRQRTDIEPHQLVPLALSQLTVGDADRTIKVVDRALELPIASATDALRVLAAAAEVLRDEPEPALMRLSPVSPHSLPPYYASLYVLIRTASELSLSLEQNAAWRAVWKQWQATYDQHVATSNDGLFLCLAQQSKLMLLRRQGNFIKTWFAERAGNKQLGVMQRRAKSA